MSLSTAEQFLNQRVGVRQSKIIFKPLLLQTHDEQLISDIYLEHATVISRFRMNVLLPMANEETVTEAFWQEAN